MSNSSEGRASTAVPPGDVMELVLAAFAEGDLEGVTRWFAPDVTAHEAASLPYGGTHRGLEGFMSMLAALGSTYEIAVRSHTTSAVGDQVFLRMEVTFTARTTGHSATLPSIEVYTFRDGLIADVDVFYKDTKALLDLLAA